MPQVFSAGWLYLFLLVMGVCVTWIVVKLRVVNREQDLDTPVIKVAPLASAASHPRREEKVSEVLERADQLIKDGRFKEAVDILAPAARELSPVEDREAMGKVIYRIGACQRRLGWKEKSTTDFLRAGEALREAVTLFSPHRMRSLRIGALAELGGLYEDLARRQNPAQNLDAALKTWGSASRTARQLAQPFQEALFLSRGGDVHRKLASVSDPRSNLEKAREIYTKAVEIPGGFTDPGTLFEKARILKNLGDLHVKLAGAGSAADDAGEALKFYEEALAVLSQEEHPGQRGHTLLAAGRLLLDIYRGQGNAAHLVQSLKYLGEAVNLLKSEETPSGKGLGMAFLGEGLVFFADLKGQREYLEKGIRLFEAALGFLREPELAAERERVREELKKAVEKRNPLQTRGPEPA